MAHYGTLSDANAFFASRLHSWDWEQATTGDRTKALNQATELIDQFRYLDQKFAVAILGDDATCDEIYAAELSQPNEFPRGTVDLVPVEIERACYLIGQALLSGRNPEMDLEGLALKSERYGNVQTAYDRSGNTLQHIAHLIPSPQAFNLLLPFFREDKNFILKTV